MYRGDLVYVGDPRNSRKSYVTIKDVLDGNTRVLFKDIRRVWYLNRILWNDVTGKEIKRTFFIPCPAQIEISNTVIQILPAGVFDSLRLS